jgi:hypothetical protein
MTNTLIGVLSAGVLAIGGLAAAAGLGDSEPARTVSLPAATTTDGTTTQETTTAATTTGTTTPTGTTTVGTTTAEDEDISGPCDEAEHADDPRCTGGMTTDDERDDDRDDGDRSGSNSGPGGRGDDDSEDRSGSNSGQG